MNGEWRRYPIAWVTSIAYFSLSLIHMHSLFGGHDFARSKLGWTSVRSWLNLQEPDKWGKCWYPSGTPDNDLPPLNAAITATRSSCSALLPTALRADIWVYQGPLGISSGRCGQFSGGIDFSFYLQRQQVCRVTFKNRCWTMMHSRVQVTAHSRVQWCICFTNL